MVERVGQERLTGWDSAPVSYEGMAHLARGPQSCRYCEHSKYNKASDTVTCRKSVELQEQQGRKRPRAIAFPATARACKYFSRT